VLEAQRAQNQMDGPFVLLVDVGRDEALAARCSDLPTAEAAGLPRRNDAEVGVSLRRREPTYAPWPLIQPADHAGGGEHRQPGATDRDQLGGRTVTVNLALHRLDGWWLVDCAGCGRVIVRRRSQSAAERHLLRACPTCIPIPAGGWGGIVGRVYLERGRPVLVLRRWGPGGGPRNVMIRRDDGSVTVRPFRGLRRPAEAAARRSR